MVIEGKKTRVQGSDTLFKNINLTSMLVDEFYLNRSFRVYIRMWKWLGKVRWHGQPLKICQPGSEDIG